MADRPRCSSQSRLCGASASSPIPRNFPRRSPSSPTARGFLLTLVTIQLIPHFVAAMGWRYAFVPLSIGPAIGVWAMARLRARPEAVRLANGRR